MPDDTKDAIEESTAQSTTIARDTTTDPALTDEDQTSESNDAPFQGRRSSGGYVPT